MKPEVNEVLAEVKANLHKQEVSERINALRLPDPKPTTPDFSTMTATDAVRWCLKNGITKAGAIAKLTGKKTTAVYTAMWKVKHPKRSRRLNRESNARRKASEAKVAKIKKPKIKNGLYEDGMETPFLDALNRQGILPKSLNQDPQVWQRNDIELETEIHRLRILVAHYEALLFGKGGK